MRHRCNNMDAVGYQHYGGRGIKVCERWNSFEKFLADMGERPAGHSIDRIDVNGNYEPDNCRWATAEAQRNNTRRSIFLTHNGETKTVRQWADALGMPYGKLRSRIKRGWTTERALS
jgi:homospermidine synthase